MIYTRTIGITFTRVSISILIIKDFITFILFSDVLFGQNAIVPYSLYEKLLGTYGLGFLQIKFNMPIVTISFLILGLLASISLLLGTYRMLSGLIVFFVLFELKFRNIFILDGADNVISAILPFLTLAYSRPLIRVRSFVHGHKINAFRRVVQIIAIRGLMIQFAFVYLFAAIDKFMNFYWREGVALYYALRVKAFMISNLNIWLTQNAFFVKLMTYSTLLWESAFPILIWFRMTRQYIVVISICMHLGILFMMRIDNYSVLMIVFYPVYFTDIECRNIIGKFRVGMSFLLDKVGVNSYLKKSYDK